MKKLKILIASIVLTMAYLISYGFYSSTYANSVICFSSGKSKPGKYHYTCGSCEIIWDYKGTGPSSSCIYAIIE